MGQDSVTALPVSFLLVTSFVVLFSCDPAAMLTIDTGPQMQRSEIRTPLPHDTFTWHMHTYCKCILSYGNSPPSL